MYLCCLSSDVYGTPLDLAGILGSFSFEHERAITRQLVVIQKPRRIETLRLGASIFVYWPFLGHGETCRPMPSSDFDSQERLDFIQRCTLSKPCAKLWKPWTALALVFHEMSDMSLNCLERGSVGIHPAQFQVLQRYRHRIRKCILEQVRIA